MCAVLCVCVYYVGVCVWRAVCSHSSVVTEPCGEAPLRPTKRALAGNTPAKVTLAPASKFTHRSQGHTCACVNVCVRAHVCVCVASAPGPIFSLL